MWKVIEVGERGTGEMGGHEGDLYASGGEVASGGEKTRSWGVVGRARGFTARAWWISGPLADARRSGPPADARGSNAWCAVPSAKLRAWSALHGECSSDDGPVRLDLRLQHLHDSRSSSTILPTGDVTRSISRSRPAKAVGRPPRREQNWSGIGGACGNQAGRPTLRSRSSGAAAGCRWPAIAPCPSWPAAACGSSVTLDMVMVSPDGSTALRAPGGRQAPSCRPRRRRPHRPPPGPAPWC